MINGWISLRVKDPRGVADTKRSGAKDKFVRNRTPERGRHAYSHEVPCWNTSETEDDHQSCDLRSNGGQVPGTSHDSQVSSVSLQSCSLTMSLISKPAWLPFGRGERML
jgi:hypothetical protein